MAPLFATSIKKPRQTFFLFAGIVTILRVILLVFSDINIGPDEAQYWFWSQSLDFGYFSKPPFIAWMIGATTSIFGDAPWAIRLSAPLFHFGTATILFFVASDLYDQNNGFWVGTGWLLMPGIILSSALITTDIPLLFFWSGAILFAMRVAIPPANIPAKFNWRDAALLGACLGFGFMAKYAMIYFPIALIIATLLLPPLRTLNILRHYLLTLIVTVIIILPNILWNMRNDFQTIGHTAANANWNGNLFKPGELIEFWLAQFGIVGPIIMAAFIAGLIWRRKTDPVIPRERNQERLLILLALTPLLVVSIQAFISRAHANWAAASYPAIIILAVAWMIRTNRSYLIKLSHGLSLSLAIIVAIAISNFSLIDKVGLSNSIKRVRGWEIQGPVISQLAAQYPVVMADDRELTGEILYYGKLQDKPVIAFNSNNIIDNHYEAVAPFDPVRHTHILYITTNPDAVAVYNMFGHVKKIDQTTVDLKRGRTRTLYFFELKNFRWQ